MDKIVTDKSQCLLVCPNWPSKPWWERVQDLAAKAHNFPPGSRVFETREGWCGPVKWGVWVLYIPGDAQISIPQIQVIESEPRGETKLHLRVSIMDGEDEIV